MKSILSIFESDNSQVIKLLTIFFIVLLTLALVWFLATQVLKLAKRTNFSKRQRQPRLAILEETEVDARRRLLLVRRDNVEHLIMLGGANDFVVEQNINRVASTNIPPQTPHMPPARETVESEDMGRHTYMQSVKAQARAAAAPPPPPATPARLETRQIPAPSTQQFETVQTSAPVDVAPMPIQAPKLAQYKPISAPPEPVAIPEVTRAPMAAPPILAPAAAAIAITTPVLARAPAPAPQTAPVYQQASAPIILSQNDQIQAAPAVSVPRQIEPVITAPPSTNFSSLEDEMAQLLGQKLPSQT